MHLLSGGGSVPAVPPLDTPLISVYRRLHLASGILIPLSHEKMNGTYGLSVTTFF